MKINILTIFPDAFEILKTGIIGRSLGKVWDLNIIDMKKGHKNIDGRPAGGGPGMILRADLLNNHITSHSFLLSPDGPTFNHKIAKEMSKYHEITFICGRYEGFDCRIFQKHDIKKLSIGDFILAGGESAAAVVVEAIVRLLPGIMQNAQSIEEESFSNDLLEHDHYTYPRIWQGIPTPPVLLSGNSLLVQQWKFINAWHKTHEFRPDLLKKFYLNNLSVYLYIIFKYKKTKSILNKITKCSMN